ncbi:MAG TPA: tRNA adenosine(34) deaminase TadA [Phycisphaerales bacterium]|nr:tRNA adenosine(34) deaminase TadA [Phycisphaerales bacterium]
MIGFEREFQPHPPGGVARLKARLRDALVMVVAGRWPVPQPAAAASALDDKMMVRALELARASAAQGEVPVGAVVYRLSTGEILGESGNTRERDGDPAGHAELLAIRQAAKAVGDFRLLDCGLAVTLEPCAMCAGAIVNARLQRVVYGAWDAKAGFAGSLGNLLDHHRLNHRVPPIAGVRGEECSRLLTEFFRDLRKRKSHRKDAKSAKDEGE